MHLPQQNKETQPRAVDVGTKTTGGILEVRSEVHAKHEDEVELLEGRLEKLRCLRFRLQLPGSW